MKGLLAGFGLAAALLAPGCAGAPAPPSSLLAIGTPLGPEPAGWEDLREVPFELHRHPEGAVDAGITLALELRPGGQVVADFDGTRALPFALFRAGTRNFNAIPVRFGSGAEGIAISPYSGWEAALPIVLHDPPPGESTVREIVLEIEFVRLHEWKDVEATLEAEGELDPVPAPLALSMVATPTKIWLSHPGFRRRRSDPEPPPDPLDPPLDRLHDLWQGRDALGRRLRFSGQSIGGGTDDSWFTVYGAVDEPIAYPVAMRFRTPVRWSSRAYRFVLRDVPLAR